jgi:ketosteroid isomerase-like protein
MRPIGILILLIALPVSGLAQQATPQENADREIRELSDRYFDAMDRRDVKAIDDLLADECFVFYPRAVTDTKASLLKEMHKPRQADEPAPSGHSLSDVKVRRIGQTAILTAVVTTKASRQNKSADIRKAGGTPALQKAGETPALQGVGNRRTLTWAKQNDRWRLMHDQWAVLGEAQEAEFWSDYFRSKNRNFNRKPNALLAAAIEHRPAGKALDVGMGEGRNAILLAKHGWDVTGVDRAEGALAVASQQAKDAGVKITPVLQSAEDFDWGTQRWDLIALMYFVGVRDNMAKIRESIKPGGLVVVEAFLVPTDKPSRGVEYWPGQLRKLFEDGFEIIRYEETAGVADYGQKTVQLVRLVASRKVEQGIETSSSTGSKGRMRRNHRDSRPSGAFRQE